MGIALRMSYILSIETSANNCSVSLMRSGKLIGEVTEYMIHGHAGALIPCIERLWRITSCTPKDITYIAVNRGPGSFTGIRLGLAAAYGFAYAGGLPILGLTSFQLHYCKASPQHPTIVALDTRRGDFYTCFYQDSNLMEEQAKIMSRTDLSIILATLKGPLHIISDIPLDIPLPDKCLHTLQSLNATDVGKTAHSFLETKKKNIFSKEPYYLRLPSVFEKA